MTRRTRASALVLVVALVAAVASSTGASAARSRAKNDTQGITDTEIRVGGVGGYSVNPVNLPYDQMVDGVNAYFAMINEEEGGVFGRELKIVKNRDDRSQSITNLLQTRALVEIDKVFAIMPVVTTGFAGARYATKNGVPVFGYHISNDWEDAPNLFGETGSASCFDCPDPTYPWLAKQLGATRVGVIGYNVDIAADCVRWQKKSYNKFGVKTPYVNDSLAFGFTESAFAAEIAKMKKAKIDMLSTCMDSNGSLLIKQAMDAAGLKVPVQWGEGYNQAFLDEFADDLDGLHMSLSEQPFEDPLPSPGMVNYLEWMEKTGGHVHKISLAGWIVADLFVTGLKAIGENPTRSKLIKELNTIDDFTANGITSGIDWTVAHSDNDKGQSCRAFLKVVNGKFVQEFAEPGKPFVCLDNDTKSLDDFVVKAAGTQPTE
jgi:ABC-type branched-subunit amino acid transport system substrate-binding protein